MNITDEIAVELIAASKKNKREVANIFMDNYKEFVDDFTENGNYACTTGYWKKAPMSKKIISAKDFISKYGKKLKKDNSNTEIEKLKKILKKENSDNYSSLNILGGSASSFVSKMERLLARIEYNTFGNADIQKNEYTKFLKKQTKNIEKTGINIHKKTD